MTMEQKLLRLIEILSEAKSIIIELECVMAEFKKKSSSGKIDFEKIKNSPISDIRFECHNKRTRFIRAVKHDLGVNTLGDLLNYNTIDIRKCRDIGDRLIKAAQEAIEKQYGINWV